MEILNGLTIYPEKRKPFMFSKIICSKIRHALVSIHRISTKINAKSTVGLGNLMDRYQVPRWKRCRFPSYSKSMRNLPYRGKSTATQYVHYRRISPLQSLDIPWHVRFSDVTTQESLFEDTLAATITTPIHDQIALEERFDDGCEITGYLVRISCSMLALLVLEEH